MLDGGKPSMDPNICYKRREYLVISENGDDIIPKTRFKEMKEKGKPKEAETLRVNKSEGGKRWVYCGNWDIVATRNRTANDNSWFSSSPLKSLHITGNSIITNSPPVGFIIMYVVRSAMPPLINDGKSFQQQHGFKAKVSAQKYLEEPIDTIVLCCFIKFNGCSMPSFYHIDINA